MMYLFFLLYLLGHRVEGQDEECWHDPCDPAKLDGKVIKKVKATDELDCQKQCKNFKEPCAWFDFGGLNHGEEKCAFLNVKCDTVANDHSGGKSGPPDCTKNPIPTCAFSEGDLQWECFDKHGERVKKDKLPVETSCITECYGNRYTSKCEKVQDKDEAKWGDLESTAGNDKTHKGKIMKPDEEGKCECDPITLENIDPNLEPGAIFHCSKYSNFCSDKKTDITQGGCTLTCDGYQYVNFHCDDGAWYKNNEKMDDSEIGTLKDDLYCYDDKATKCPSEE